jgi:hypothetical protein
MSIVYAERKKVWRPTALLLSFILMCPLFASCGGGKRSEAPPPPVDDTRGGAQVAPGPGNAQQARKGLSTGQKVGITLVGAAALYYLYRQHQKSQQQGSQGKYYLSKNGRVYYRDQKGQAHWVSPPPGGIQVPAEQAQQYRDFQGYNGRATGRDLTGVGQDPVPAGAQ